MKKLTLAIVIAGVMITLLTTRFGVFIVFDVLGDLGPDSDNLITDPQASPLTITKTLTRNRSIVLPEVVEQASGITVADDRIFISTDQAELFELSHEGAMLASADLIGGPLLLKQGSLEAILIKEDLLQGIGELGAVAQWQNGNKGWLRIADQSLPASMANDEFTGMTLLDGQIFAVTDEGLDIRNITTGETISVNADKVTKSGRSQNDIILSGITNDGQYLYLLSENYSSLLQLDPANGTILRVLALDRAEGSDVSIHKGEVYVTVDHNYFDARPPIHVYQL